MSRPLWFVDIIKHFYPDRFTIAGWTKKSKIIRKVVDYFLFDGDEIYYLLKNNLLSERLNTPENQVSYLVDITAEEAYADEATEGLETITAPRHRIVIDEIIEKSTDMVVPSDVVRHFIRDASYIWINNKCICRESMQCKDYPIDLGCIFMGEAVLKINPKLGRLVSKEEAMVHLQRADDLGLVHMIGRNKIDTQWMGVSPGGKLLSVCQCCPCCCLYKVLPSLDESISSKVTRMPGVEIIVDERVCIGCGSCTDICFTQGISIVEGVAKTNNLCVGCGRCIEVCPENAIQLSITRDDYMEETVRRLHLKVDVT